MSFFIYNGGKSSDFGLEIEKIPNFYAATLEAETSVVPGRSGLWLYQSGRYENIEQEYEVYLSPPPGKSYQQAAKEIANWLCGPMGYLELSDSYDPDSFRLARFVGPLDMTNWFEEKGRAKISFDCQPERYRAIGKNAISLANGSTINNPGMPARCILSAQLSAYGTDDADGYTSRIKINGNTVLACSVARGTWTAELNTYTLSHSVESTTPQAGIMDLIYDVDFSLPSGENQISIYGGASNVKIIPRWWDL